MKDVKENKPCKMITGEIYTTDDLVFVCDKNFLDALQMKEGMEIDFMLIRKASKKEKQMFKWVNTRMPSISVERSIMGTYNDYLATLN